MVVGETEAVVARRGTSVTRLMGAAAIALSMGLVPAADADAAHTRRRHSAPAAAPAAPRPHMYYPQEVEGGSTGNLPFNNQIRKHTDPLNANGAR